MKSVLICGLLLALAQYGYATKVCNKDLVYSSALATPCLGNDVAVLWPNYKDLSTYYKCVAAGKAELRKCPPNKYFTYYFQQCTDCSKFIEPPPCEYLQQTTDVTCKSDTTSRPPVTIKPPTTIKPTTTTKVPTTLSTATTNKSTKTTKAPSSVPTPPNQSTPSSTDIPMPPMVVTPVPGIPTPPNENVTPPSIPGTPPMLTTVPSK